MNQSTPSLKITPTKTAKIISEVLPYIKEFRKKVIVIKLGGHAMVNDELKKQFTSDLVLLSMVGFRLVVVHGGGPQIGQTLKVKGVKSEFVKGLRKTSQEVMAVVEEVLMQINQEIVAHSLQFSDGDLAVSINGAKKNIFYCQKQDENLGFVGEVKQVNTGPIWLSLNEEKIPIVCPIGRGEDNQSYNINADTAAAKLAIALQAEKLILLTDTAGVMNENQKLISKLNIDTTNDLIAKSIIKGGMIPKVRCAMNALTAGVKRSHIIDGRTPHALLIELLTNKGIGTVID